MLLGKKQSPDRPRVSQKLSCTHGRPFNGSPSAILVSPVGAVSLRRGVGASVGRKGCSRVVDCPPLLALVGWCRRQCARLAVLAELSPFWVCHTAARSAQRTSTPGSTTENPGGRPELRHGQAARAEESGMRAVGGGCPSQQLLVRTAQLTTHNAQNTNKMEIRHAICHGWLAAVFISSCCFGCFCCFISI